jgi:hypothetical protein
MAADDVEANLEIEAQLAARLAARRVQAEGKPAPAPASPTKAAVKPPRRGR